jgi:hypothetical protein
VAGNGTKGYGGDGGPAVSAELNNPNDVAMDSAGNLYIADFVNSRVRKVDTGGIITTVAGNGTQGYSGDGGAATSAEIKLPEGIAVDDSGNLYIADNGNSRIRKVSGGIITTVAGNGTAGYSGDGGPATATELNYPTGVAVDATGNLYIADFQNSCIRKVSGGIITTVAGLDQGPGYAGDGGPATAARLNYPTGVSVLPSGELFIADTFNNRIRKVDAAGIITTVAGNGTQGYGGDGGPSDLAELYNPMGICVESRHKFYIGDAMNNRVRKVY